MGFLGFLVFLEGGGVELVWSISFGNVLFFSGGGGEGGGVDVEDKWGGGGYVRNFYNVLTNGIVGHMGYIPLFWLTKIDVQGCGSTRSVSGFYLLPQMPS